MSDNIVLGFGSLLEAVTRVNLLGCQLGKDCKILADDSLSISLDWIDEQVADGLKRRPRSLSGEPVPVERIDRQLYLSTEDEQAYAQIDADYLEDWLAADGNPREADAIAERRRMQLRNLRLQVVDKFIRYDIQGKTLIYGDRSFPKADYLIFPDGAAHAVETLIHYTHPGSPEEEWLRERRITAQRIIRYRVPPLDDAAWIGLNQPTTSISARRLREIINEAL